MLEAPLEWAQGLNYCYATYGGKWKIKYLTSKHVGS